MLKASELHLFAGPTLAALSNSKLALAESFEVLPPIKRGDLPLLCRDRTPGVLVIVDGVFHNALSVSHAEIRNAIHKGWEVWGLSSIGAIRAYEMSNLGMHGFGSIFELYCHYDDFQDDEVALLHESIPPYQMISEPLVHIRAAIKALQDFDLLSVDVGNEIITTLKNMWFGERTLKLFWTELEAQVEPKRLSEIQAFFSNFDRFRLKTLDLEKFLTLKPYLFN